MDQYNTLFVGKVFMELDRIDSTNNYAHQLLRQAVPPLEGTVIYAAEQFLGRGQRGSTWLTEPYTNATLSIIFYPKQLKATEQFILSCLVALGVYNMVKMHLGEAVSIKWPNDIYYQNSKIAGILIENTLSGQYLASSVVGIGLNVNQTEFDPHLPNPTSLKNVTGQHYLLTDIIGQLNWHVERQYLRLKTDIMAAIRANYLATLYGLGEWVWFELSVLQGQQLLARITDVLPDGRLVLQYAPGYYADQCQFYVKEIKFVPKL